MLSLLAVGTKVEIGYGADHVVGHVNAICIRERDYVTYEVVWWDGRNRRSEWLARGEIRAIDASSTQMAHIGFAGTGDDSTRRRPQPTGA